MIVFRGPAKPCVNILCIRSYAASKNQKTRNYKFLLIKFKRGAPQCSILGTLLFLLHKNDLSVDENNGKSIFFLYADDTFFQNNEKSPRF